MIALALLSVVISLPVLAQSARQPTITVAPTIPVEPASPVTLAIRIGPAEAVPRNSFVRLRGLPPMAALSEGHSIAPGSWAVAIASLPNLKVTLPPDAAGRSEIVITLVAVDGAVLGEAKSTLVVSAPRSPEKVQDKVQAERAAPPPAAASIMRAGTPPPPPPSPPPVERSGPAPTHSSPAAAAVRMTPQDRERAERLLKKGHEHLAEGNVSAARLFYERAAEVGFAPAAMALAATFDEAELARINARGISPDRKEARRWYERARQLGAAEAEQPLRRLGGN